MPLKLGGESIPILLHPLLEKQETDVLVIGGGAAGIRAALSASMQGVNVTVWSSGRPARHGATFSPLSRGWGFQALMGAERTARNLEIFYQDILRAGLGCCRPELARILVEESGVRLADLMHYGLRLRMDAGQKYLRMTGCFSREPRAFLTSQRENILHTFRAMLRRSRAAVFNVAVLGLLNAGQTCLGAWGIAPAGKLFLVRSRAVILACGGGAALYLDHVAPREQTGSGYALALEAGAELENLEFIQFLLGLKQSGSCTLLPLEQLKPDNRILGQEGRDPWNDRPVAPHLFGQRKGHAPFSSRDASGLIDLAMAEKKQNGEKVFLSGFSSKPVELRHVAQAFNGGVCIDTDAASDVPGLYAAGEVAAGPHGADRLGGCMLTATQVFGHRAGLAAARYARKQKAVPEISLPDGLRSCGLRPDKKSRSLTREVLLSARKIFSREVMILRNKKGLQACLQFLSGCLQESRTLPVDASSRIKLQHSLITMTAVAEAALARNHSLGPHYRTDSHLVHHRDPEITEKN